jgi:beta-lactam-binding protein with PASTA domain
MLMVVRVRGLAAPFLISVLIGWAGPGCGSSTSPPTEQQTVTVERTVTSQTAPSAGDQNPANQSGKIRVPNVVGMNHQAAQDTMQSVGLYNLAEEDATGQGRVLLYDRGWQVVSQSPAPGSVVPRDTTVTLRSKKYGE